MKPIIGQFPQIQEKSAKGGSHQTNYITTQFETSLKLYLKSTKNVELGFFKSYLFSQFLSQNAKFGLKLPTKGYFKKNAFTFLIFST